MHRIFQFLLVTLSLAAAISASEIPEPVPGEVLDFRDAKFFDLTPQKFTGGSNLQLNDGKAVALTYNLCNADSKLVDVNGDITRGIGDSVTWVLQTTDCGRNFTSVYYEPWGWTLTGYDVQAWIDGLPIDIFRPNTTVANVFQISGRSLKIQITQTKNETSSFHQLFGADVDEYKMLSAVATTNLGTQWAIPPGTKQKYVVYQPSSHKYGLVTTKVGLYGDCANVNIWKGLTETQSSLIYGGIGQLCTQPFYRNTKINFFYGRYMIFEVDNNEAYCNLTVVTGTRPTYDTYYTNTGPGVLTSPPYLGTDTDNFTIQYNLWSQRAQGQGINLDLMSFLPQGATLEVDDKNGNRGQLDAQICHYHTDQKQLWITYSWQCTPGTFCDNGLIMRYSDGDNDFYATTLFPPTSPGTQSTAAHTDASAPSTSPDPNAISTSSGSTDTVATTTKIGAPRGASLTLIFVVLGYFSGVFH